MVFWALGFRPVAFEAVWALWVVVVDEDLRAVVGMRQ
jgi:hypothetical protein